MPFDFRASIQQYKTDAAHEKGSRYPREKSWDYLWDYVEASARVPGGRSTLVTGERLDMTALHIGFYLASWGMFRGQLLYQNLDFFRALSQHVFREIDEQFWSLTFAAFAENTQAMLIFNDVHKSISNFLDCKLPKQKDKNLITGKLLLGVWGQCPALDTKFKDGWKAFQRENGSPANVRCKLRGELLKTLNILARERQWELGISRDNGAPYPAGKVIDMAFFQYGKNISRSTKG
jgi:hypothetical protein